MTLQGYVSLSQSEYSSGFIRVNLMSGLNKATEDQIVLHFDWFISVTRVNYY
jgi:hypothetical protein